MATSINISVIFSYVHGGEIPNGHAKKGIGFIVINGERNFALASQNLAASNVLFYHFLIIMGSGQIPSVYATLMLGSQSIQLQRQINPDRKLWHEFVQTRLCLLYVSVYFCYYFCTTLLYFCKIRRCF